MNDYTGWNALLRGEKINVDPNEPFTGFYRMKRGKDGPYVPVAYWREEGALRCVVDGKMIDEDRAVEIWPYCVRQPIAHETYLAVAERGEPWPDMDSTVAAQVAPPSPGHNNPPQDEAEILREQIEAAAAGIGDYQSIEDDGTAARAQSLRSRLLELSRTADKKRETEKKPHMEAAKAVDTRWMALVKAAKEAADKIAGALSTFETQKLRREREAQRKAEEEARKAAEAGKPVPVAAPTPPPAAPIKGAYGRAASVKVIKVATITDQDKLYAFLRSRPEVVELLGKLAQRAVDAGQDVPGVTVEEQRKVA